MPTVMEVLMVAGWFHSWRRKGRIPSESGTRGGHRRSTRGEMVFRHMHHAVMQNHTHVRRGVGTIGGAAGTFRGGAR